MHAHSRRLALGVLLVLGFYLFPVPCPAAGAEEKLTTGEATTLDTAGVLALAKRRFEEASAAIEPRLAPDLIRLVGPAPRFDGAFTDEAKGRELSNAAVSTMLSPDSRALGLALACAAVDRAPRLPVATHNLAAALYLRQEKTIAALESDPGAAKDAAALYRYVLSLDPARLQTWVNLGNVEMDLKQYEEARACFESALKKDPACLDAHLGLATYWLALGDQDKARQELQSGQIRYPASVRQAREQTQRLEDPDVAPQVTPDDEIETMEEKLQRLRELKPMSTADIIEPFDPVDAQQIRIRVNNLPEPEQLRLPELTSITMFGTYEAYFKHHKYVESYKAEVEAFFKKWGASLQEESRQILTDFGGSVSSDGKTVNLPPEMSAEAMKAQAARWQAMAKNKQIGQLMKEVYSRFDPELLRVNGVSNIVAGEGGESVPALEGYLSSYNFQVYNKKSAAWNQYWRKYLQQQRDFLMERDQRGGKRIRELTDEEARVLEELQKKPPGATSERETIEVKLRYLRQRNQQRESMYHDGFDTMVLEYRKRIRPNLEAMWADLVPHIRLMQAGMSRDKRYMEADTLTLSMATNLIGLVIGAAEAPGEWEDPTELEARLANAEQAEARQKEENEQEALELARQDFARANAPGGLASALLDKLSFERELGPIKLKITPSNIEISGGVLLQGAVNYNWSDNTVKGSLGVGCSFSTGDSPVGASGSLGTTVTFTYNTQSGRVAEIDWTGNASASASLGVVSAGVSYETSVMHGNTLTVDATSTVGRPTSLYHDEMKSGE